MSESTPARVPFRRRGWRRWLLVAGVSLLVLFVLALSWHLYRRHRVDGRIREVEAELDRTDPRWRREEIEADQVELPDDVNGATSLLAAWNELPRPPWNPPRVKPSWETFPPPQRLDARTASTYRTTREEYAAAVVIARRLAEYEHGRYPSSHRVPYWRVNTDVVWLLATDAVVLAEDDDLSAAMRSSTALLVAGHCLGKPSSVMSAMSRMQNAWTACLLVERILAQGELNDDVLAATQTKLAAEDGENLLRVIARANLAQAHADHQWNQSRDLVALIVHGPEENTTWWGRLMSERYAIPFRETHARELRLTTELVSIADLAPQERTSALDALEAAMPTGQGLAIIASTSVTQTGDYVQRHHAKLRTLQVALAAERYRLKHQAWPASAEALVPTYLERVPLDPYTGAPVRFALQEDGVSVSCAGAAPKDVGIRLWDVAKRRQPAPPPPAEK